MIVVWCYFGVGVEILDETVMRESCLEMKTRRSEEAEANAQTEES